MTSKLEGLVAKMAGTRSRKLTAAEVAEFGAFLGEGEVRFRLNASYDRRTLDSLIERFAEADLGGVRFEIGRAESEERPARISRSDVSDELDEALERLKKQGRVGVLCLARCVPGGPCCIPEVAVPLLRTIAHGKTEKERRDALGRLYELLERCPTYAWVVVLSIVLRFELDDLLVQVIDAFLLRPCEPEPEPEGDLCTALPNAAAMLLDRLSPAELLSLAELDAATLAAKLDSVLGADVVAELRDLITQATNTKRCDAEYLCLMSVLPLPCANLLRGKAKGLIDLLDRGENETRRKGIADMLGDCPTLGWLLLLDLLGPGPAHYIERCLLEHAAAEADGEVDIPPGFGAVRVDDGLRAGNRVFTNPGVEGLSAWAVYKMERALLETRIDEVLDIDRGDIDPVPLEDLLDASGDPVESLPPDAAEALERRLVTYKTQMTRALETASKNAVVATSTFASAYRGALRESAGDRTKALTTLGDGDNADIAEAAKAMLVMTSRVGESGVAHVEDIFLGRR